MPSEPWEEIARDADRVAAYFGENPYSSYLRKHRRRPLPVEAGTIGRLMNARVKANDGKMYPPPSSAERKARKIDRQQRRAREQQRDAVLALRSLIIVDGAEVAGNDNPASLARAMAHQARAEEG